MNFYCKNSQKLLFQKVTKKLRHIFQANFKINRLRFQQTKIIIPTNKNTYQIKF